MLYDPPGRFCAPANIREPEKSLRAAGNLRDTHDFAVKGPNVPTHRAWRPDEIVRHPQMTAMERNARRPLLAEAVLNAISLRFRGYKNPSRPQTRRIQRVLKGHRCRHLVSCRVFTPATVGANRASRRFASFGRQRMAAPECGGIELSPPDAPRGLNSCGQFTAQSNVSQPPSTSAPAQEVFNQFRAVS